MTNSHADAAPDSMAPALEQWLAWPTACYTFWLTLQLEWLSELAKPTLAIAPWMAWHNGTEQLA